MSKISSFSIGDQVLVREIWDGKVWSARSIRVIQDTPEMLALYMTPKSHWRQAKNGKGERVTATDRRDGNWSLEDAVWEDHGTLRLTVPGSMYSVIMFWDNDYKDIRVWYINLEDPLRRTPFGFDYIDYILDVVVSPDLSSWYWKDGDDFTEATRLGLITGEKSGTIRTQGIKTAELIQSGKSPYTEWKHWKPDTNWPVLSLPDNWNKL